MSEVFSWTVELGSWFGTRVRVRGLFLVFVALSMVLPSSKDVSFSANLAWNVLFLFALVLRETARAWTADQTESDIGEIDIGPLGNMSGIIPSRRKDTVATASAAILANGIAAILSAVVLRMSGAMPVFSPFGGGEDAGAPLMLATQKHAVPLSVVWWIGWFGWLNWVLFLANIIPALPLDGGRVIRAFRPRSPFGSGRDEMVAIWCAHSSAAVLTLIGFGRLLFGGHFGSFLILVVLALLIEQIVRAEARLLEEGGFLDDGAFGYDFSEGYTGLEKTSAAVRPARESAIKRWRRRRSESRRRRREAQEAADDRRLDEILDKVHRLGKPALTDEEGAFLLRQSAKIRSRAKDRE